jgi:hypothetical protein
MSISQCILLQLLARPPLLWQEHAWVPAASKTSKEWAIYSFSNLWLGKSLDMGQGWDMGQAQNNLKFMFLLYTRMLLFVPLQQHWSFELAWYSIITPNASILSKIFGFCMFFLTRRGQKFSWVDNQLQQEKFWLAVLMLQCRSKLDNWGAHIHILLFCVINFFWNRLFLWSVNTNIWIWALPCYDTVLNGTECATVSEQAI